MNHTILETQTLTKTFRSQEAVRIFPCASLKTAYMACLAPTGTGKSTLLKMITGILRPTSGQIRFQGHPWSRKDLATSGRSLRRRLYTRT